MTALSRPFSVVVVAFMYKYNNAQYVFTGKLIDTCQISTTAANIILDIYTWLLTGRAGFNKILKKAI